MYQVTNKAKIDTRAGRNIGRTAPAAALLAAVLMSGCTAMQRDHVVVGSVPQDYRTNHPITFGERETVYDIPVASSATGLMRAQEDSLRGFLAGYDARTSSPAKIIVPSGSPNAVAAERVAGDIVHMMVKRGIPASRIATFKYQASADNATAPVRISFVRLSASVEKCGRWPEDLGESTENRNWTNFGCSYQNNLAAQIANPADLLGPRERGDIDGTRRAKIIDTYETADTVWSTDISY